VGVGTGPPEAAVTSVFWSDSELSRNPSATNNLAVCLLFGFGVPQNRTRAVAMLTQASRGGCTAADNNLAVCYLTGAGLNPADGAGGGIGGAASASASATSSVFSPSAGAGLGLPRDPNTGFAVLQTLAQRKHTFALVNIGTRADPCTATAPSVSVLR
jgi:uncharacterized protein